MLDLVAEVEVQPKQDIAAATASQVLGKHRKPGSEADRGTAAGEEPSGRWEAAQGERATDGSIDQDLIGCPKQEANFSGCESQAAGRRAAGKQAVAGDFGPKQEVAADEIEARLAAGNEEAGTARNQNRARTGIELKRAAYKWKFRPARARPRRRRC